MTTGAFATHPTGGQSVEEGPDNSFKTKKSIETVVVLHTGRGPQPLGKISEKILRRVISEGYMVGLKTYFYQWLDVGFRIEFCVFSYPTLRKPVSISA